VAGNPKVSGYVPQPVYDQLMEFKDYARPCFYFSGTNCLPRGVFFGLRQFHNTGSDSHLEELEEVSGLVQRQWQELSRQSSFKPVVHPKAIEQTTAIPKTQQLTSEHGTQSIPEPHGDRFKVNHLPGPRVRHH